MLFLIGLVLFITLVFVVKGLSSPDPEVLKRAYKITMIILGIVMIPILLRVGKPLIAALIAIILAAIPYLTRLLQLAQTVKIFHGFLDKERFQTTNASPHNKMTQSVAREILEISENASQEEIEATYKRLIKKNHPDIGGSKYFTIQLNQARELLLKDKV
jgi:hypothetical protein